MNRVTRLLPPLEWAKLTGTEAETVWPVLPADAKVIVVEDDAKIVGCWILMPVWHAECVWIDPAHRKGGSVARRLWTTMRSLARSLGAKGVFTAAIDAQVGHLLQRHGAIALPGTHYVIPIPAE